MLKKRIGTKATVIIVIAAILTAAGVYFLLKSEEIPKIVASAGGFIYDYDNRAGFENYKNGVLSITVVIQPESAPLRNIGDPAYGGTTITVTNPTTGFTASVSLPDNTYLWGTQITAVNTVPISAWGTDDVDVVKMTVYLSPDNEGRLSAGSLMSIMLAPYGIDNAHDQSVAENRMTDAMMWDERQTINITIIGRDSVSLTGWDGVYLQWMDGDWGGWL